MDGHRMSWMRSRIPWIAALATLVIVPAASADHHGDDHGSYGRYGDDRSYDGYGYGDSRWDDPGRMYDRNGYWQGYYWPGGGPYPEFASLDGYGRWTRVPGFGQPLWFPYVAASWRPYFYGYWIDTRFGMTWVSYEPWGDVPTHYGHWIWVDHYGWGWVPGWEWGPAWVTWGVVDGYIGWAPLPPAGYRYPAACRYSPARHHVDYRWSVSFRYDSSGLDFGLWVFVPDRDFYGSSVHSHALPATSTLSLFKQKKVLPVGRDLSVDYVKRVSPSPVRKVDVVQRTAKTTGGRTLVFQDPRGQESRVRDGREAAKRMVTRVEDPRAPERTREVDARTGKSREGTAVEKTPAAGKTREQTTVEKTPAAGKTRGQTTVEKTPAAGKTRGQTVVEKAPAARTTREVPSKASDTGKSKQGKGAKTPPASKRKG